MKINLAGYNVDRDMLGHQDQHELVTPETISAAYARISRAPEPVDELRAKAAEDVKAARKSNEKIVFGYGHNSVAEHAVLNFDIIDVSRLAIEFIEHSRLASYTEKSQRYVTFAKEKEEFVIPKEIRKHGLVEPFKSLMRAQCEAYHAILALIKDQERPQGGSPQEDARYVTSLAVTGQLGMTVNARVLEQMIRRLASVQLEEAHDIASALFMKGNEAVPSLLKHMQPEPLRYAMPNELETALAMVVAPAETPHDPFSIRYGTSPSWDGVDHDALLLATLSFQQSRAPIEACNAVTQAMPDDTLKFFFKHILEHMDVYSAAPRAFELIDFAFQLVVSASCFAQLKRHRMATLLPQSYDPNLGFTVPQSIQQCPEALRIFFDIMRKSIETHELLLEVNPLVASYALTQAHRRRVLFKLNLREVYAFSRLRQDCHAQWEIRAMADEIVEYVKRECPLAGALLCGKDTFEEVQKALASE
jgi:thymidylate synthase ThyX